MTGILLVLALCAVLYVIHRVRRRVSDAQRERVLERLPEAPREGGTPGMCPGGTGVRLHPAHACGSCGRVGCLEMACPRVLVRLQAPDRCRHCQGPVRVRRTAG